MTALGELDLTRNTIHKLIIQHGRYCTNCSPLFWFEVFEDMQYPVIDWSTPPRLSCCLAIDVGFLVLWWSGNHGIHTEKFTEWIWLCTHAAAKKNSCHCKCHCIQVTLSQFLIVSVVVLEVATLIWYFQSQSQEAYYCDVLLSKQFPQAICQFCSEFIFQQKRVPVHTALLFLLHYYLTT